MTPEDLICQFHQSHCATENLDGAGGQDHERVNANCVKIKTVPTQRVGKLQREEALQIEKAATDFCKGEAAKEKEGKKYSPSSAQFTEKHCMHSKKSCHSNGKGAYSPFSQQSFYAHNLSTIAEWIPLCFHSEESVPDQCAGIFQLKQGKTLEPWECVMGPRQFLLRLAASLITGVLCISMHICIFRELPVSTKI